MSFDLSQSAARVPDQRRLTKDRANVLPEPTIKREALQSFGDMAAARRRTRAETIFDARLRRLIQAFELSDFVQQRGVYPR